MIVFGCIVAYLVVGFIIAKVTNRRRWLTTYEGQKRAYPLSGDHWEGYTREIMWFWWGVTVFFWPLLLPAHAISGAIEKDNPVAAERRSKALQKRIDELERDLGMK